MDRPGIRSLIADIETGRVRVVLIYKLERILRSTFEWGRFSRFLEERGCRLISPNEDLSDTSASGRLKTNILVSFAEYERLNVAEKIRSKMLAQAERGMWGGGMVPFGYDYDREQQQLIPNKEEAEIVRQIFERAAALVPLRRVAMELNESGMRTRIRWFRDSRRNRRCVGGKLFRADALRLLIQNPIYRGAIRYGSNEFRGQHEPLISVDTWKMANASVRHPDRASRTRALARDKYSNLLKGILVCECCGQAMLSKASGKSGADGVRYRYYSCKRRYAADHEPKCPLGDIVAEAFEKGVIGFIGQLHGHEMVVDSIFGDIHDAIDKRKQQADRLGRLESRLENLNLQVTNCVEALAAEGVRALTDDLTRKINHLGRKREMLWVEREQQRQKLDAFDNSVLSRERFRFALRKLAELVPALDLSEKKNLLRSILESVLISRHPPESSAGATRVYRVTFGLRLAELISAMERGRVIDDREEKAWPYGRRILDVSAEFILGPRKRVAVRQPFTAEFGEPPAGPPCNQKLGLENPISRAEDWEAKLRDAPGLSLRALAEREGHSAALVSLHLKMLKMAPDIVAFVRGLRTFEALRVFSYRSLLKMAKCDATQQRRIFDELRRKLP